MLLTLVGLIRPVFERSDLPSPHGFLHAHPPHLMGPFYRIAQINSCTLFSGLRHTVSGFRLTGSLSGRLPCRICAPMRFLCSGIRVRRSAPRRTRGVTRPGTEGATGSLSGSAQDERLSRGADPQKPHRRWMAACAYVSVPAQRDRSGAAVRLRECPLPDRVL